MPAASTNPKVAIILPVFNTERYPPECLRSILEQKYQELDVFAVNDESPDNSRAILEEFSRRDPRVHIIDQKNSGASEARNTGLSEAEARNCYQYISFVDSDDTVAPDFLSNLVSEAENTAAEVTICGYSKLYDDGTTKEISKSVAHPIANKIDFLKLVFSIKEGKRTKSSGGMVWEKSVPGQHHQGTAIPCRQGCD